MKRNSFWLFLLLVLVLVVLLTITGFGQKKTAKKTPDKKAPPVKSVPDKKQDVTADEKKVRDMVAFLEYMLNTLGNSSTPIRDKEVLITESYAKVFRDSKVQVEDDLDAERNVITNKDIVAYLKDVNFFFTRVRFEFTIESIEASTLPDGQYFYKVATTRNLKGITSDQVTVNNTQPRFIEINYNPRDQDLKIVSIYTNEFDEGKALAVWWSGLSYEWKSVFKREMKLPDSVQLKDLKHITAQTELNISGNTYLQTLAPLAQLRSLRTLDLSRTHVIDLAPIRNLTELVDLNLSGTQIKDISFLKYASRLEQLNISNTWVRDIDVIEKMPALHSLEMEKTPVVDFRSLTNLVKLEKLNLGGTSIADLSHLASLSLLAELNLAGTAVQNLEPLRTLKKLIRLNLDSTKVADITPLAELQNLNTLQISNTLVSDLSALQKLERLEKVYCDQTQLKQEALDVFRKANPKVLLILDSKDLKVWWEELSQEWRDIFVKATGIGPSPTKEELSLVSSLDSVNLTGCSSIRTFDPLRKLTRLKVVLARNTGVTDLTPLRSHREIQRLDISETEVRDIRALVHFHSLKVLKADRSKVENMASIQLASLEAVYVDQTEMNDILALEFLEKNPKCLLVYKTVHLNRWWANLPSPWKGVFEDQIGANPKTEALHKLVEAESLHIRDASVMSLAPLAQFVRLKDLQLSGTQLTSLSPIEHIKSLTSLHATRSPIQQIDSLDVLTELVELDISDTPLDDLYAIWKLKKLATLNCSGTQIKRLDALEKLENLEYLDCSNTNVTRLSPLDYLPLKMVKCYNTKISGRTIESFKASHPECRVVYYR